MSDRLRLLNRRTLAIDFDVGTSDNGTNSPGLCVGVFNREVTLRALERRYLQILGILALLLGRLYLVKR